MLPERKLNQRRSIVRLWGVFRSGPPACQHGYGLTRIAGAGVGQVSDTRGFTRVLSLPALIWKSIGHQGDSANTFVILAVSVLTGQVDLGYEDNNLGVFELDELAQPHRRASPLPESDVREELYLHHHC